MRFRFFLLALLVFWGFSAKYLAPENRPQNNFFITSDVFGWRDLGY
jgi:hypothetical protein